MRVLVCGGRTYTNQRRAFQELDAIHAEEPITLIIEGGAEGADRQGRYWALAQGIPCMTLHAAWSKYGRAAGHIRNEWMIEFGQPNLVVAFPGGSGTEGMKKITLRHDIKLRTAE